MIDIPARHWKLKPIEGFRFRERERPFLDYPLGNTAGAEEYLLVVFFHAVIAYLSDRRYRPVAFDLPTVEQAASLKTLT